MPSSRVAWAVAASLAAASSVACGHSASIERQESLAIERLPAVDLRLQIDPAYDARAVIAARRALTRLGEWLGPYPHPRLTVVRTGSAAPLPAGAVAVGTPWLSPARSGAFEAGLVLGIAGQFWSVPPPGAPREWLREGLALYVTAKVLDDQFLGEHAYERRSFGGLVPHVLRSVPIAGPDAELARLAGTPQATRAAVALFTLERYLGWGTLQQALEAFIERSRTGPAGETEFFAVLDTVSGRDLRWFMADGFAPARTFDYGVERLLTAPATSRPSSYDTSVVVRRYGDAVFAGSGRPATAFQARGPIEVLVSFADGSEIREHWDGRDTSMQYDYESKAPAIAAAVDPDRIVWLDRNPANNRQTITTDRRGVLAWAARWSIWMQDNLLDYAFFF